jgi:hypothetical protein
MTAVSETTAALIIPTVAAASDQEAVASEEEVAVAVSDPAAVEAVASEVADNFKINNYSKK